MYNLHQAPGGRVVSLNIRCLRCLVPTYSPVEKEEVYNLLINDWLIKGGDGYDVIKNNVIEHIELSKYMYLPYKLNLWKM